MTKQLRRRLLPWVLLFFWLARPVNAQSSPPNILITEVYPAPIGSGSEWIELYNPTNSTIDLTGWSLEDQLSAPSLITTLTQSMPPATTLVILLPVAKLNNTADGVTLKNAAGTVIDTMSYGSSASDQSWSRTSLAVPATWNLGFANPGQFTAPTPSPTVAPTPSASPVPSGSPTPFPTPPPTPFVAVTPSPAPTPTPSSGVILTISELSACPETGQSEWVEVYNPTAASIQLQNFLVRDASGNTELLNGTIAPEGYSVFFWSKSLLNNAGDSLFLIANTGQILDSATYDDCQSGRSLALIDGVWSPVIPSPGKANLSPSSTVAVGTSSPTNSVSPSPTTTPQPPASPSPRTQFTPSTLLSPDAPLSQVPWWPANDPPHTATTAASPSADQSPPPEHTPQQTPGNPDTLLPLDLSTATAPQTHFNPYNGIIGGLLLMLSSGSVLAPTLKQVISHVQATAPAAYPSFPTGPPIS